MIKLTDGKAISDYYKEIIQTTKKVGLDITIQTKPQEMAHTTPFEEDKDHHHYSESVASQILNWFQFARDAEQQFIAPFRQRKVYPGLFRGTFDVSCIIIYNELEDFPDDGKVIERAAFDEHMIEFGFWLGDDTIENPCFFTLPYPFVDGVELEVDDTFPTGSYFNSKMAEYLYEIKSEVSQADTNETIRFLEASCKKALEYLKWQETQHFFEELKMDKNKK